MNYNSYGRGYKKYNTNTRPETIYPPRKQYNMPAGPQRPYSGKHTFNGSDQLQATHHFGSSNYVSEEKAAQDILKKMVRSNTLTVCSSKTPEYYLKLIRYHFMKKEDGSSEKTLSIQALGLSCQNLVFVACLVTMKGYATYKRIKNDHISVPVADSSTGAHLGLVKKVRLTVKLQRSDNYDKIIEKETTKKNSCPENQPQP